MVTTQPLFEMRGQETLALYVYDTDFKLLGRLAEYSSLVWEEDYAGRGTFTLVCVDTQSNTKLLQQGRYLIRKDKSTAMVIRYQKVDTNTSELIVRGHTTLDLLGQRVIYQTQTISHTADGMTAIVRNNLRGLPHIEIEEPHGLHHRFETQFTGTRVLEALEALGAESGYGYRMLFDRENRKHVFQVYEGLNRIWENPDGNAPQVFSTEFKNLASTIIVDDMSIFRNVAFVAGGGEGEERTWIQVGDAEGLSRFETYVDARDLQREDNETEAAYKKRLTARGVQKLNDFYRVHSFVGGVSPIGFGTDFSLGDIVTCSSSRYGVRINTRILHFAEIRERNSVRLNLTLGEPEIDPLKVVSTWLR